MLRLKKSGQENEIAGLGRPSLTHMYGSSPDEYMMYLLKQDMGEAENSLPVLDLFRYLKIVSLFLFRFHGDLSFTCFYFSKKCLIYL